MVGWRLGNEAGFADRGIEENHKKTTHATCEWGTNKQVLLGELVATKADGSRGLAAVIVTYWDPDEQKLKTRAYFSGNVTEERTLISTDGNEQLWESRMVFPSGNQGFFRCRMTHEKDTYILKWSKISGSGPKEIGPLVYKRK